MSSSIVAFAFRWRMIVRALSGLTSVFSRSSDKAKTVDPLAEVEVPSVGLVVLDFDGKQVGVVIEEHAHVKVGL